jgi:hypothetical protein
MILWIQHQPAIFYNGYNNLIPWYPWYNNNLYCYILLDTIRVMQYEYISLSQSYPEQGDRLPAAGGPPPMRIPGAARRTPRHPPRLWISCYYIVFFLLCHLCYSISAFPKTHKPRGRASDVSTISTCFSFMLSYTAHSPTNLYECGWGYHCRVLVRLLALYAKLNWFFPKKPPIRLAYRRRVKPTNSPIQDVSGSTHPRSNLERHTHTYNRQVLQPARYGHHAPAIFATMRSAP